MLETPPNSRKNSMIWHFLYAIGVCAVKTLGRHTCYLSVTVIHNSLFTPEDRLLGAIPLRVIRKALERVVSEEQGWNRYGIAAHLRE